MAPSRYEKMGHLSWCFILATAINTVGRSSMSLAAMYSILTLSLVTAFCTKKPEKGEDGYYESDPARTPTATTFTVPN